MVYLTHIVHTSDLKLAISRNITSSTDPIANKIIAESFCPLPIAKTPGDAIKPTKILICYLNTVKYREVSGNWNDVCLYLIVLKGTFSFQKI